MRDLYHKKKFNVTVQNFGVIVIPLNKIALIILKHSNIICTPWGHKISIVIVGF